MVLSIGNLQFRKRNKQPMKKPTLHVPVLSSCVWPVVSIILPTECMYKLFTTLKVVLVLDFKEQMIFPGNDSLKKKKKSRLFKMWVPWKGYQNLYFISKLLKH